MGKEDPEGHDHDISRQAAGAAWLVVAYNMKRRLHDVPYTTWLSNVDASRLCYMLYFHLRLILLAQALYSWPFADHVGLCKGKAVDLTRGV